MPNEIIFYTQVVSIIGFVVAIFVLYRILVSSKDATITLLKTRLEEKKDKIADLQSQSPDVLLSVLSERIDIALKEIARLKEDSSSNKQEIGAREAELVFVKERLSQLSALVSDSDLICPDCGAPVVERNVVTKTGYVGDKDVDIDLEVTEYDCGLTTLDGEQTEPCGNTEPH